MVYAYQHPYRQVYPVILWISFCISLSRNPQFQTDLPNQLTTFLAVMFFLALFHLLGAPLSIGLIMASLRMDIQYWLFCLATHSAFDAHLTPPEAIHYNLPRSAVFIMLLLNFLLLPMQSLACRENTPARPINAASIPNLSRLIFPCS